jgi:arylsulfatase A-like enzyme
LPNDHLGLRRLALLAVAASHLLVASAGGAGCARPPAPRPKNILLITIDTLRSDRLGAYGNPTVRTPTLDRLAREGAVFASARSPIPLTLPSHTSILTGLYPRTHLVLSHAYTLAPGRPTLATILKEHGYATAAFVSSHVLDKKYGLDRGFDVYWQRWETDMGATRAMNVVGLELTTKAAKEWLKARPPEGPFFLWVHFFQPHKPYAPPPPLDRLYDPDYAGTITAEVDTLHHIWHDRVALAPEDLEHLIALYDGEVTWSDLEVGKVLATLEAEGLLDDTVVMITADHGEVLYEHDFYFGHDIMLYEPALSVPLIVRAPGLVSEGAVVGAGVRLIDVAPTLLDAAGIPPGEVGRFEGTSLLRVASAPPADTLYAEVFPPKAEWKTKPRHAVATSAWKLILEDESAERELYDVVTDPAERENRAASEPETLASYLAAWEAWRASRQEEFVTTFPDIDPETEENLRSLGYIDK